MKTWMLIFFLNGQPVPASTPAIPLDIQTCQAQVKLSKGKARCVPYVLTTARMV